MDIAFTNKQLITVEFPGTVTNMDKFEKTLGGEKEIFSAFANSSKRMELKFRPDDPYCKSAHGDRFNTTNILLKFTKRTRKKKIANSEQNVHYEVEFLGIALTSYKFKALVDFQIPPITYDETKKEHRSMIPDLVPTSLHPASWLDNKVKLFIPPLLFSRFDIPQNGYHDMHAKTPRKPIKRILPPNIIGQSRQRRAGFAVFTTFENPKPIMSPQPEAILQIKNYPLELEVKESLDSLFLERPIWTRTALVNKLKIDRLRIKHALPCSGYYFTNGPWRAAWVRFGYNPRSTPEAKIFQTLDLRINANIPIDDQHNKRRQSYYMLPSKIVASQQKIIPTINTKYLAHASKDKVNEEEEEKRELTYEYFPGILPTSRQCFLQLCDIHLDSVQELVHRNDGKEDVCREKDGWCLPGTIEKCRELLIADIIKTSSNG